MLFVPEWAMPIIVLVANNLILLIGVMIMIETNEVEGLAEPVDTDVLVIWKEGHIGRFLFRGAMSSKGVWDFFRGSGSHGQIERIVVTPDARLAIVDDTVE